MIWNLPNMLTWLRILAIPLVVVLFLLGAQRPDSLADPIAGLLFAAAAITDSLDGYLARRLGQTTRLGSLPRSGGRQADRCRGAGADRQPRSRGRSWC